MKLVALPQSDTAQKNLISLLQNCLVSALDIAGQAKQAHWNVKGSNFIALHELFDKIHGEFMGFADMIAERIVILDGQAYGTSEVVATSSILKSYPLNISAQEDHIEALTIGMVDFSNQIRPAAKEAEDLGDSAAGDLFIEVLRETEKLTWFVRAHSNR
jgi:starvation-inducible DNA-binding protein